MIFHCLHLFLHVKTNLIIIVALIRLFIHVSLPSLVCACTMDFFFCGPLNASLPFQRTTIIHCHRSLILFLIGPCFCSLTLNSIHLLGPPLTLKFYSCTCVNQLIPGRSRRGDIYNKEILNLRHREGHLHPEHVPLRPPPAPHLHFPRINSMVAGQACCPSSLGSSYCWRG